MEENREFENEGRIVQVPSDYERLLEEVNRLRAEITRLTALRDDLIYRVCPGLRAEYEEKIGSIERQILAAQMYLKEKQRILELLRAQMNRKQKVSYESAEGQARKETDDYEKDLRRKAEEAEKARRKWEQTGWSSRHGKDGDPDGKGGPGQASGDGKEADGSGGGGNGSGEGPGGDGSGNGAGPGGDGSGSGAGDGSEGTKDRIDDGDEGRDGDGKGSGSSSGGSGREGGQGGEDGPEGGGSAGDDPFTRSVKSLYRKILKRLHPDVNPNQTEHDKELFLRAQAAYENGDYDALKRIWDELEGMKDPEETYSDTPEDREKLKALIEKLRAIFDDLVVEIDSIRGSFPYTMKELLENEELLAERRSALEKQLKEIREADAALAELIRQIREKLGK